LGNGICPAFQVLCDAVDPVGSIFFARVFGRAACPGAQTTEICHQLYDGERLLHAVFRAFGGTEAAIKQVRVA